MHFFKAFSILAAAAFATVAVALPAADTNAILFKRQATAPPQSVPFVLNTTLVAIKSAQAGISE
jgi:hypothetical protein